MASHKSSIADRNTCITAMYHKGWISETRTNGDLREACPYCIEAEGMSHLNIEAEAHHPALFGVLVSK